MLPYLHERRVLLNKLKPNTKYFYTLVQKNYDNYNKEPNLTEQSDKVKLTHVICMNMTENKFHVYFTNGALVNRIVY